MKQATLVIFLVIFCFVFGARAQTAQCPPMPAGTLCISQATGNAAATLAREKIALENKITALEQARILDKQSMDEQKETARKNEADLKEALHKTENELSTKTGQLIGAEAMNVRLTSVVDLLLKQVRKKCMPFSVCLN